MLQSRPIHKSTGFAGGSSRIDWDIYMPRYIKVILTTFLAAQSEWQLELNFTKITSPGLDLYETKSKSNWLTRISVEGVRAS